MSAPVKARPPEVGVLELTVVNVGVGVPQDPEPTVNWVLDESPVDPVETIV
jgi:hypothetical protein